MKLFTRALSLLMIIAIFISAFCINTSAASPTMRNTGKRDVLCTALSDDAKDYYTGSNTYDTLSAKSSSELLSALRTLMKSTHSYKSSYDNCRDWPSYTDSEEGKANIVLLYSSVVVTQNEWAGGGSTGWNREHVWPQSLGGFKTSGAGADLHHVRPSDYKINGDRGNLKYGNVSDGLVVKGTSIVSNMVGGQRANGYFEPLDNVKGDVARICLYVYARYGGEISECSKITNVFQSVDVLLEWCEEDPVDTWEMSRNDVVESIQGNRNVFIDYPEYAFLLFGKSVPADMETPSGEAMDVSSGSNGSTAASDSNEQSSNDVADSNDNEDDNVNENDNEDDNKSTETKKTEKKTTKKTTKKTDKNSKDEGCGSSVAISSICIVGVVGIMALVKKKED